MAHGRFSGSIDGADEAMASRKTLNAKNLEALGAERLAELLVEVSTGNAAPRSSLRGFALSRSQHVFLQFCRLPRLQRNDITQSPARAPCHSRA